jgi:SAM-dependent methyltransferase
MLAGTVEATFALAGVGPGLRVLDLGAGTGDQTLLLAERVGASGSVLATDLSAAMLELLAEDAAAAGLANVETLVADAAEREREPRSFAAAGAHKCRHFVPRVAEARARVRRALKPGARLAAVVYAAAEHDYMGRIQLTVRRVGRLGPPDPDEPGLFRLGAPGRLGALLRAAGFREVAVESVSSERRFASRTAAVEVVTTSPSLISLLDRLDDARRAEALAAVRAEVGALETPAGVRGPVELLLGVGTA